MRMKQLLTPMYLLVVVAMLVAGCQPAAAPAPQPAAPAATEVPAATVAPAATEAPAVAAAPTATEAAPAEAAQKEFSLADFKLDPRIQAKLDKSEKPVIRVSYHDVSNEFAPLLRAGVEQAAAELGVDAKFVGPVGADAEAQIAEIESLIAAGVDGLAVSSVSTDALGPVIDRAIAMGIPVVTFNTDNPDSQRLAFAGQDLVTSGYAAAQELAKRIDGKGNVLILTLDAAAQWSIDRETGARNGLAEYPDIKVLATINTGTEPQEIYGAVENALLAHPETTAILSMECCSHPVAGEVLVRENLVGKITMVGFDELPQTLKFIKDGVTAASVTQAPQRQGFEAVRLLVDFLAGKPIADLDTGIGVIDPTNVDEFLK